MEQTLKDFVKVCEQSYECAREWQKNGGKVIGLFPMHSPAELVHAAGALPIVFQETDAPITAGHTYIYPFYCGLVRSIVDVAMENKLDFVDGIIAGNGDSCIQALGASEILKGILPEKDIRTFEQIPYLTEPYSFKRAKVIFLEMKKDVEELTGNKITNEALWESIRLFNRSRQLLREIFALRTTKKIRARELQYIVKAGMIMDRKVYTEKLETLLEELKKRENLTGNRIKVALSGHLCQPPKTDFLSMIEESGADIVWDDLYHGFRYAACDISTEINDPMDAITDWYIRRNGVLPCPTRIDMEHDWDGVIAEAVEKEKADGVIILQVKYCEPHIIYYPELKKTFDAKNIPHILLETEHEVVSLEQMRTRIETFVEMLKSAKRG